MRRLNPEAFRKGLAPHSDRDFVDYIVSACTEGVDIGYRGPRYYRESPNWPSTTKYAVHVQADIDKHVAAGTKIGPFFQPPFANFVGSPMGAFPKKRSSTKFRIIHDLSWPPGHSVNEYISKEDYRIQYLSLDEIITSIKRLGQHTLLAKLDLESAFHHIPVRAKDYELLGSTFYRYNPATNSYIKEYYYDTVLQFGARSAPCNFTDFAVAARLVMKYNGATYAEQYLDDFITMGKADTNECQHNLDIMIQTCHDLSFAINPDKLCNASTVMEYLGIILDTNLMQARISQDQLHDILDELLQWTHRKSATKRQILSLVGKLQFVSHVVRPGRTFVHRMINLAKQVPHLHHRIALTSAFQKDVAWWIHYLPCWNGVSLFYQEEWESSVDMHIYTDSSDLAAAGYYQGAWFVVPFAGILAPLRDMSINWRELFAIVVAAATFGHQWSSKRILFHCDNMCIVEVLNSGTCKSDPIMDLVRHLFYISAKCSFELSACYVNTKVNDIADSLSRLQFARFRTLAPGADCNMTPPLFA